MDRLNFLRLGKISYNINNGKLEIRMDIKRYLNLNARI